MNGIGSWVMRRAIATLPVLCQLNSDFRLFFNLSAIQLEDTTLIDRFIDAANVGVRLDNLGVEITETAAMRDLKITLHFTSVLQEHGVHIAIDDFGIGFSSLALLRSIPVDVVKIDRTFVASVLDDPRDAAIAEAIIFLGTRFGYTTVAEGVERPEQIEWLRTHGCRHAQGFSICHPLPLESFCNWLAKPVTNE